jgi:hypothetical protein
MRHYLRPTLLVIALLFATIPVAADSLLQGDIDGIELCPQSLCGLAVFAGGFDGSINGAPRHGVFLAGITHDPQLPDENGESVAITGGSFLIRVPFRTVQGAVLGGSLTSNGDQTFDVEMVLFVRGGGLESFVGTLRHDVFPPTIAGTIE